MNRRTFLATTAAPLAFSATTQSNVPWYRRTYRWGQTNITEADPPRYDIPFWRDYWKRTATQAVIINAGGIVAYYPSKFPLHHRAEELNGRDLFGELTAAAHQDGLVVLARMDSNRTAEDFLKAHPDWFARDAKGEPYRAADKYITCINSDYYNEYLPEVMREIIARSRPEGFTDNSWAGLDRGSICYCDNCARKFAGGLPRSADWDDPAYRKWIMWNYQRRLEVWDLNNRVTTAAGGPHCVWVGMNSGHVAGQARTFRDIREICRRSPMVLLDHQRRADNGTFQQNADTGKLVHGVLGWDKIAPESMAMYQSGSNSFRVSAKPAAEARMWMISGFAGGIQPWWHHVGAWHEDRRAYRTAEPLTRWYRDHEAYLVNRTPVATVGVVWSQRNTDFYGRDHAEELTEAPYRGVINALVRARIPYIVTHIDDIARDAAHLDLLILPELAAMSDAQTAAVKSAADRGLSILATGLTGAYTEWGDPRPDFALAGLLGVHRTQPLPDWRAHVRPQHTYLRIGEGARHEILKGFEETAILPFGGSLGDVRVDSGATVPLTYIPPFPVYPPETAWMRTPKTDIPGLILREAASGSRIAYMPADIDRRYSRDNLPDHARLLANVVRWTARKPMPLNVSGPGLLDCHLYEQPGRRLVHLVNLTNEGAWRAPIDELLPVGPFTVDVKTAKPARTARLLVAGTNVAVSMRGDSARFDIPRIADHELAVLE